MAKKKFYAVVAGHQPGIYYDSWDNCQKKVEGYKGSKYRGFVDYEAARAYYAENGGDMAIIEKAEQAAREEAARKQAEFQQAVERRQQELLDCVALLRQKLEAGRGKPEPISDAVEDFCRSYAPDIALSDEQKRAIQAVDGKVLLFAVPGSGKTTVLTIRAGYLLFGRHGRQIAASEMMNLTFTKAAARSMQERFAKRLADFQSGFGAGSDALAREMAGAPAHVRENAAAGVGALVEMPEFRTIHSFCWRYLIRDLRVAGYDMPPRLIDMEDENGLADDAAEDRDKGRDKGRGKLTMTRLLEGMVKKHKGFHELNIRDESVRDKLTSTITFIKNRMMEPDEYAGLFLTIDKVRYSVTAIFQAYEQELAEHGCMDFDDMLRFSLEGLKARPEILARYQKRYKYWSIDETQDNSPLQYELLSLLAGEDGNLFVVGDDDQSIYFFRGARPGLLLEYGVLDRTKALVMSTNYRSGSRLVDMAHSFIRGNSQRAEKNMLFQAAAGPGQVNFLTQLPNVQSQYRYIVAKARECERQGTTLAVIYRVNASVFPVMFWLKKAGIPFRMNGYYKDVAYSKCIGMVILILSLACNPGSFDLFKKCRFWLKACISDEAMEKLEAKCKNNRVSDILSLAGELHDNSRSHCREAGELLRSLVKMTPFQAAKTLLEEEYIPESPGERLHVYAVLGACLPYRTVREFVAAHQEFLEDEIYDAPVTLTTMHSSKGLEFDRVIIVDPWQDLLDMDIRPEPDEFFFKDAEESRRLFYVAATRARKVLDICAVANYYGNQELTCCFVEELAFLYDAITDEAVQESSGDGKYGGAGDSEYRLVFKQKFYGVKKGRKPGIYKSCAEAEQQVAGYSGALHKSCDSLEEAVRYVYGKEWRRFMPVQLSYGKLQQLLHENPVIACVRDIDLPQLVRQAVCRYLGVDHDLRELSGSSLEAIRQMSIKYGGGSQATDYHGRADYYVLAYMLMNFYKLWLPLWEILRQGKLKPNVRVLELGPGPGTATLALLSFYCMLALDNRETQFSIDYVAVEREEDFVRAADSMVNHFIAGHPCQQNLHINFQLRQQSFEEFFASGYGDERGYDLVLESNALNDHENVSEEAHLDVAREMLYTLRAGGHAVFIEPRGRVNCTRLQKFFDDMMVEGVAMLLAPRNCRVYCSRNTLLQQVVELGIRSSNGKNMEHGFSCMVLEMEKYGV
ncbi:MAG: viroplasmin family protein [Selenomonadaceae bacterium]|nr:viroplasmin family protein [Selenomonadaceae bacterium]